MNLTTAKTEKAVFVPYLHFLGKTLLVILLSRTQAAGAYPFGIAYAAALAEENVLAAALGLIIGAAGSSETAIKYILAAAIYGAMVYLRKFEERQVKAVALGAALILASLVSLFVFGATPARLIMLIPEAFAAGGLYSLFKGIKGRGAASYAAETVLAGVCLGGLYGIRIPYLDISLSVFAAMIIVMSASLSCGVPVAVLTGGALGFLVFLNHSEAVAMSGMFAVSALLGALTAKTGKTGVAAGFLTGLTVCVLCMGRLGELSIADIFAAPIAFLIIPQKTAVKIGSHINEKFAEKQYEEEFAGRVQTVAKAVENLGSGVRQLSKNVSDEQGFFDDITARVCGGCKNEEICNGTGRDLILQNVKEMRAVMDRDGYLNFSNLPKSLGRSCIRAERFLSEFLHIFEMEKQRELLRGELFSDRELVAKQYGEISDVINSLSKREDKPAEELKYAVSVSVRQEAKKGQTVNGDTVLHFKAGNKYFVILCDGMGSGAAAREISGLTAGLFAEFFGSGIEKGKAVDMINSAIALNAGRESFSSADILEFDLVTGRAEFLKLGSAQSFIKKKGEFREVASSVLPIGILESIEVNPQTYKLSAGDEILMITDGIGEAASGVLKNEWIKKVFLSEKESGEERTRLILEGAMARSVFSDDKTAVIIQIEDNEE